MYKVTSVETRQPQKAPSFAVIWGIGIDKPEIVNTTQGKPDEGMSFVSKQTFAGRFCKLYKQLSCIAKEAAPFSTYMDAKEKATLYNVSI